MRYAIWLRAFLHQWTLYRHPNSSSYFRNAYLSLLPIAVFSFPRQSCDFCALREVTLFLNLCPHGHKMPLKYLSFHCVLHCCKKREREMFYLTTHSTHFIYSYMASDTWLRTILIVRNETRCRHIGYSYQLTAKGLLYAPSHRQDKTYHGLCYTSRGALAGTKNSSMGPPHEGSIRRPTAPWANAIPLSYVPLPPLLQNNIHNKTELLLLHKTQHQHL